MKAYVYDESGKATTVEIPADMKDTVDSEREALIENIAEADDALIEKYLDGQSLSEEEIKAALRKGTIGRIFVPVLMWFGNQKYRHRSFDGFPGHRDALAVGSSAFHRDRS
jgi:translation elongation factor EF-G